MTLIVLFLLGIYLNVTIQLGQRIPFPDAPVALIAMIMLWRQKSRITQAHLAGLSIVFLVYFASMFFAPKPLEFFGKRFTGLVQLMYSMVLAYALFLTMTRATRRQMAKVFLGFCLVLVIGCLLETYGGLRPLSDKFRLFFFQGYIYAADLRDQQLYGRIRPKLFTSEPSYVTFAYTIFLFAWFMFSEWRWKFWGYLTLVGIGQFAMPGPTLLLSLALIVPYELFLGGRVGQTGLNYQRVFKVGVLGLFLAVLFVTLGLTLYGARLRLLSSGEDASFFVRETGPALLARYVAGHYPIGGAGLTSEVVIANQMLSVYEASPAFYAGWSISNPEAMLTNYFWSHWIYLGIISGAGTAAAITFWLRTLKVPSAIFSWAVWAIMGQALGGYVAPRTWFVLFVAAAAAVLHQRVAYAAPTAVLRRTPGLRPAVAALRGPNAQRRSLWRAVPS
jgi:hypothetical protein